MIEHAVIFSLPPERRYRDRNRADPRPRLALHGTLWLLALVIFA